MKKIFFLSVITFMLSSADAFAGTRYWIASSASNWNNTANWSTISGGGGGASVPGSSDTAYYDATKNGNCSIDANVNIKYLNIASGHTGTISQGTYSITIGTTGAVLSGGTFTGGSGTITISGPFTISGCAFTSTSGTLSTNSNFTISSGSFSHNSGLVKFTATLTITGSVTMYQLEFAPASVSTYTIASGTTVTVANTLTISGSSSATFNTGGIDAKGNITITNTGPSGGGTATFVINGTDSQTLTGSGTTALGYLPNVTINKTAGTLSLASVISVKGDWVYTAGTLDAGTSSVYFVGTKTISGSHSLNGVLFGASASTTFTLSSGTILTVNGGLTIAGGGNPVTFNTGAIHAKGSIVNTNISGSTGGSGSITINGTGNQTLTGGTNMGEAKFPNIIINKPAGTLTISGVISPAGDWTYTAGTIDPGTSTVFFATSKTISGSHALNTIHFSGGANYTYTIESGTVLTANGNLDFSGSKIITINTGQINVLGNITTTNSSTSTGGTALIKITGEGNQTLTGSGTAGAGKLPNVTIDKPSGILTLSSIISVTGNWIFTSVGTGSVDPGTSSLALYGTFNLDGTGASGTMSFYRCQISSGTRTITGSIDCNDNFTISTGATCNAGANTITIGGNFINQGTWNYGTSTVVFDGVSFNKIQQTSGTINFANVTFNRRWGKSVTLKNPVVVNTSATFACGRVKTDTTNFLEFADNATCSVTNNDSAYVHGPVRKTGNDAFTFPLGDTTLHDSIAYHPFGISAPGSITDKFQAVYYASAQTQGSATVDSITALNNVEHWTLERKAGTSSVTATLSWNRNAPPSSISDLRVAGWNGTTSAWADLGQESVTVNWPRGTITATAPAIFNSPAVFTTASALPSYWGYATLKRKLDGGYYETKKNALYFRFDDEYNDQSHNLTYHIYNSSNTDVAPTLVPTTNNAALSYYGDNRFKLDLWTTTSSLSAGYYILEVRNEKNEVFYLRFKKS